MKYPAYPAYTATDPNGASFPAPWPVQRLRFHIQSNPVRSEVAHLAPETLVTFVPMEAVHEWGGMDTSAEREVGDVSNGYTYFANGDVVIAKITPCFENGKGAIAQGLSNGVGFGTTELHVIRPNESLSNRWVFYLTMSHLFRKRGEAEMFGAGGQKRVPEDFIRNLRVGIPSLDEQERIADFLDWRTAQIDALIAKKQALLERLREQRQSLVARLVTRGLDRNAPTRDTDTPWLRQIPAHWDTIPLGFLTSMSGGMTPSMNNPAYWNGDVPWVTPKDMKQAEVSDATDHVTELALSETGLSLVPPGAILIVVRGMILAHSFPTAMVRAPVTINQDMKALRCADRLDSDYLFWCLNGFADVLINLAQESAHGTKKMETETIKKFVLPVPPLDEQQNIAKQLSKALQKIDQSNRLATEAIDRLTEYRSALITAAVTGQIDVRGVPVPATA